MTTNARLSNDEVHGWIFVGEGLSQGLPINVLTSHIALYATPSGTECESLTPGQCVILTPLAPEDGRFG